jgi:hypothetical protein
MLVLAIASTGAEVTELNAPSEVAQGKEASISGKASPNEAVWLSSSFEISLPVSDGKYRCDFTGVDFPAGEKTFSVTAENVKNIRASLSPVFWQTIEYPLSGPEKATANSIATLSISFPATMHGAKINIKGKKDVTVYGDAADKATSVNLKSAMSIKVTADSKGDFVLNISTEGVPTGEFLITSGEIEKTVRIVSVGELTPALSPPPSPSPTPMSTPTPTPTPQKTTKPFLIPGFELIGCVAALLIVVIIIGRRYYKKRK